MEDVSKGEGRTVLFVSHNITAIKTLCNSGILLSNGKIANSGNIGSVIEAYKAMSEQKTNAIANKTTSSGKNVIRATEIKINGVQPFLVLGLKMTVDINKSTNDSILVIDIINSDGVCVFQSIAGLKDAIDLDQYQGRLAAEIELHGIVIDSYTVNVYFCTNLFQNIDSVIDSLFFEVTDTPVKEKINFDYKGTGNGYVYPITRVKMISQ